MIPKTIHYCWFGASKPSPFIRQCMATWRDKLPHYTLREWNESNFDVDSVPFVRDAYAAGKWAFVADYVRLHALYTEGGIYLDTDVKILRPLDNFLHYNLFGSHELHPDFYSDKEQLRRLAPDGTTNDPDLFVDHFGVHSALVGSVADLPYLRECLEYYRTLRFDPTNHPIEEYIIGRHISRIMTKYGYRYCDEDQLLDDNMMIFNSSLFVGNTLYLTPRAYSIHLCNGSWCESCNTLDYKLRNNLPRLTPLWSMLAKIRRRICYHK
ncbi:MAG: glycosyltransferase [Rikenellaceae bacterium]